MSKRRWEEKVVEGIGSLLEEREWGVGLIKTHACMRFPKKKKDDQEAECPQGEQNNYMHT